MATIRQIRRRIRSVQSTAKITKAMEMVAASRMRRAQERDIAGRPYAQLMRQVLADLGGQRQVGADIHPLLAKRPVNRIGLVHITPDRGLCGGLHGSMNRKALGFVLEQKFPVNQVVVGRKGVDFMVRYGQNVEAEFTRLGDQPLLNDIIPIAKVVIDDYSKGVVDEVYLSYAQFVNTMVQKPTLWKLLPIEPPKAEEKLSFDYIYEPSAVAVLADILPRFVEMQLYHAVLEAVASEQSARMVAMRSATENARELIQDLTLVYNKVRQDTITRELLDIIGGAVALE